MVEERTAKRARSDVGGSTAPVPNSGASPSSSSARLSALESLPDDVLVRILASSTGSKRADGVVETIPRLLARVARISRRFRQLAQEPGLWQHVVLIDPCDATVEGLARLPAKTRKGTQSIRLLESKLSDDGFHTLLQAFGDQLQELQIFFDNQTDIPFSALPLLQHFSSLRSLTLHATHHQMRGVDVAAKSSSAFVQRSLALLGTLSLGTLDLWMFPVSVSTLQAIAAGPSRETLRSLEVSVLLAEGEPHTAAIAAIGSLEQLENLSLGFRTETDCSFCCPDVSDDDLRPLAALTSLKKLAAHFFLLSLEFLRPLTSLADLDASISDFFSDGEVDFSPLLASAGVLRRLRMSLYGTARNLNSSIVTVIPQMLLLEDLSLACADSMPAQLAGQAFGGLKCLRSVTIERYSTAAGDCILPGPFLKRLASDVPSIQKLRTGGFSLPLPEGIDAVSALRRLPRLELAGRAASSLDVEARRYLRAALPFTRIVYEDGAS